MPLKTFYHIFTGFAKPKPNRPFKEAALFILGRSAPANPIISGLYIFNLFLIWLQNLILLLKTQFT
jgi:hypothetical protein